MSKKNNLPFVILTTMTVLTVMFLISKMIYEPTINPNIKRKDLITDRQKQIKSVHQNKKPQSNQNNHQSQLDAHQALSKQDADQKTNSQVTSSTQENVIETLEWDLSQAPSPFYQNQRLPSLDFVKDEDQKKNYEWLESFALMPSQTLDLAAKEVALFYQKYEKLPPSRFLYFFLESYGATLWGVQQSIQVSEGPFDWQNAFTTFIKNYQHKSEKDWIGTAYLKDGRQNILVILTAAHKIELPPIQKNLDLDQDLVIKAKIPAEFHHPYMIISKPDGSFFEIKSDELAQSSQQLKYAKKNKTGQQIAVEYLFDLPGRWDIEIMGENSFGPQPLCQLSFYVQSNLPKKMIGKIYEKESLPDLEDIQAIQKLEQKALNLLNLDRSKFNLPALLLDPKLSIIATAHSEDMKQNHFFGHHSPQTGSLRDRLQNAKYRNINGGENIAYHQNLNEAEMGLMYSIGHRQNILSKDFNRIGIGLAFEKDHIYLTQLFSKEAPVYDRSDYPALVNKVFSKINQYMKSKKKKEISSSKKLNQIVNWRIQEDLSPKQILEYAKQQEIYGKLFLNILFISEIDQFELPSHLKKTDFQEIGIAVYQSLKVGEADLKIVLLARSD